MFKKINKFKYVSREGRFKIESMEYKNERGTEKVSYVLYDLLKNTSARYDLVSQCKSKARRIAEEEYSAILKEQELYAHV